MSAIERLRALLAANANPDPEHHWAVEVAYVSIEPGLGL